MEAMASANLSPPPTANFDSEFSDVPLNIVITKHGSLNSNGSLSPVEFERMINTNFPHELVDTDLGFDTMLSNATNATSAGITTLYLQAQSSHRTPSPNTHISFSDSLKETMKAFEDCCREYGRESGIGVSPVDTGYTNNLNPPALNPRWSLNSDLEQYTDFIGAPEACLYTEPEIRVERQVYSLDGMRRSSFETLYSPPVVTEQVVSEIPRDEPQHEAVICQMGSPSGVVTALEVSSPMIQRRAEPRLPRNSPRITPSTSVTTSISQIISSPTSEALRTNVAASVTDTVQKQYMNDADTDVTTNVEEEEEEEEEEVGHEVVETKVYAEEKGSEKIETKTKDDTPPAVPKRPRSNSVNQSEKCGQPKVAVLAAPPIVINMSPTPPAAPVQHFRTTTSKILMQTHQPQFKQIFPTPIKDEDYEWTRKVQQITQWQADVNSAMQRDNNNNGAFVTSPTEVDAPEKLSDFVPRPKPAWRQKRQILGQPSSSLRQPPTQPWETVEFLTRKQSLDHPRINRGQERNDDASKQVFGIPTLSPSQSNTNPCPPRLPRSANVPVASISQPAASHQTGQNDGTRLNGVNKQGPQVNRPVGDGRGGPFVQSAPKGDFMLCQRLSNTHSRLPDQQLDGYAEVLRLATAANAAVKAAFDDKRSWVQSPTNCPPQRQALGRSVGLANFIDVTKRPHKMQFATGQTIAPKGIAPQQSNLTTCIRSFNGTGKIHVRPRPANIAATSIAPVISNPIKIHRDTVIETAARPNRLFVNIAPSAIAHLPIKQKPNVFQNVGVTQTVSKEKTRSRSVGPHILPPPADVNAYPLVKDMSKGLRSVQMNNGSILSNQNGSRVQALRPKKFILGHVASNEDICIETETPFAFNIAATGRKICIAKVASADDLQKTPFLANSFSSDLIDLEEVGAGIPVSLRLTFGSTPCINTSDLWNGCGAPQLTPIKTYRSVLHINMIGKHQPRRSAHPTDRRPPPRPRSISAHTLQLLPGIPRPPSRSPQLCHINF